MEKDNRKTNEQEIEKPVLEGLRVLGRMIAREIYNRALERARERPQLPQEKNKQNE